MNILPPEVCALIFRKLRLSSLISSQAVNTNWHEYSLIAQIDAIKNESLSLRNVFSRSSTALQVVDWLIHHPMREEVKRANFNAFPDFDNHCLKRLTENCPNITHLSIQGPTISGDALKYLFNIRNLLRLTIYECHKLEKDALKHLVHAPSLQILYVVGCDQLEEDALKHLIHVPSLQILGLSLCEQLKSDSLMHLGCLNSLRILNIFGCLLDRSRIPTHLQSIKIEG